MQELGAHVHLAHPLGVKAFEYRRVKNDERDATDLADLLRMGRLPEAWIAPPATRELRELVRHRAKLVGHPQQLQGADPRGAGQVRRPGVDDRPVRPARAPGCSTGSTLPAPYAARVGSLRRLIDDLDVEIDLFARLVRGRLAADPGYRAVQTIPGIGPILGAVFVAEIGDVHRFPDPHSWPRWAGLTPKHHESDTHVHRGRITKQGSRLVRWAAIESVQVVGPHTRVGGLRERVAARRGRNIGKVAAARRQLEHVYYALRDGHVRALQHHHGCRHERPDPDFLVGAGRAGHDPHRAWSLLLIDHTGQRLRVPHHAATAGEGMTGGPTARRHHAPPDDTEPPPSTRTEPPSR